MNVRPPIPSLKVPIGSMMAERAYLDWNATAPLVPAARDAMLAVLDAAGNPSSVHREGRTARAALDRARGHVARLVGADPAHVVFTSGATEAASLVLSPAFRMGRSPMPLGLLHVSATEHPCVLSGGRFSPERVRRLPVDRNGVVDRVALAERLAADPGEEGPPMVAVQAVNNETGVIQPIAAIAEIVHAHQGLLVVDAVQAAGRMPLSIDYLGADFLILSSHKIGGPMGAGALVMRGEALMPEPLVRGGGQEKGHRAGTENVAAIAGFGAAAQAVLDGLSGYGTQVGAVRARIEAAMRAEASDVVIHGRDAPRIANTIFFSLPGLKAETAQIAFDLEGVALSAGSACSSGKIGRSHVLESMGADADLGALRLSIGPATRDAEIERFLAAFARINARRAARGLPLSVEA